MVIVALGDSITSGQGLAPDQAWPAVMPFEVHARGVPGDTTRLGLERFPRDVQELSPDIVIIQFGHNDANRWQTDRGLPRVSPNAYRANLVEMVDRCRAFGAEPYLCSLTPTTRSEQLTKDTTTYDFILRQVARSEEVKLIDVRRVFTNLEGLLLEDGLHLSAAGQRLYADTVAEALL